MASTRQKLKLDEQSFEGLLAAAYTIQQHNDKRKAAAAAQKLCDHCGAPMPAGKQVCIHCGSDPEGLRPGEKLQRNWASLWLMSQNEDWRPTASAEPVSSTETTERDEEQPVFDTAAQEPHKLPIRISEVAADPDHFRELLEQEEPEEPTAHHVDSALVNVETDLEVARPVESPKPVESVVRWQHLAFWKRRLKLRFSRADLYLVLAIAVAAVALFWVVTGSTAPKHTPVAQHKVHLTLWESTLVGLGLAEAPEPPVYRGDPSVKVWVDPHTALYYCSGEDEYGKTSDGHFATQRDAQMDQFEPSERAACE
jgi:hypothetical protein